MLEQSRSIRDLIEAWSFWSFWGLSLWYSGWGRSANEPSMLSDPTKLSDPSEPESSSEAGEGEEQRMIVLSVVSAEGAE